MANTFNLISSTTLSSAASSVTFSGIPQTYTDLVLRFSGQIASSIAELYIRMNTDTASNYSNKTISGDTAVISGQATNALYSATAYTYISSGLLSHDTSEIYIADYASTSNKQLVAIGGKNITSSQLQCGQWRGTTGITSLYITNLAVNFTVGTHFELYGIKNA